MVVYLQSCLWQKLNQQERQAICVNKGFMAGIVLGGLFGAYYGLQMARGDRSQLRNMAMRLAKRGRRVLGRAGTRAERVMEDAADMLVD